MPATLSARTTPVRYLAQYRTGVVLALSVAGKNDASAVLGSVQEYADNNGGGLPSVVTVDTTTNTAYMCSSSPCAAANGTPAKVGFFNATATSVQFATTVPTLSSTSDTLYVMKSFSCSGNTPQPGSQRSVIVYYAVEPNATPQCVGS